MLTVTYLKMEKNDKFKIVFGYKTTEKRQNEKIGYAISILLPHKENKLCLMKIGQLVQKL